MRKKGEKERSLPGQPGTTGWLLTSNIHAAYKNPSGRSSAFEGNGDAGKPNKQNHLLLVRIQKIPSCSAFSLLPSPLSLSLHHPAPEDRRPGTDAKKKLNASARR